MSLTDAWDADGRALEPGQWVRVLDYTRDDEGMDILGSPPKGVIGQRVQIADVRNMSGGPPALYVTLVDQPGYWLCRWVRIESSLKNLVQRYRTANA